VAEKGHEVNEETEFWRGRRHRSQQIRAEKRDSAPALLHREKLSFAVRNEGTHYIVAGKHGSVDFWPGTGLWIDRATNQRGRGIRELARFCRG
jgi:hypothetical protein